MTSSAPDYILYPRVWLQTNIRHRRDPGSPTGNNPKCGCSRPDHGQAERNPARVYRDNKQLEDGDEVQVKIVCEASERPDDRDGDDGGSHHTPVSKLEQFLLFMQLVIGVTLDYRLPGTP